MGVKLPELKKRDNYEFQDLFNEKPNFYKSKSSTKTKYKKPTIVRKYNLEQGNAENSENDNYEIYKYEDISDSEVKMLKSKLNNLNIKPFTPREQIIFNYRYIIFKQLLIESKYIIKYKIEDLEKFIEFMIDR